MKKIKVLSALLAVVLLFGSCSASPNLNLKKESWNTNYKYVFVHGLSGWGGYDSTNKYLKYWGMFGGDLMAYLNNQGFDCYAASVDPQGSAWDRACELYAQLTGTVVDYGEEHSKRCNHERFGKDFSSEPLIKNWSKDEKINLIGHSFGGATIRLLCELMENGSEEEKNSGVSDISPLFLGGKGDWIYSVTALAAPHNGTTAYNVGDKKDEINDELTYWQKKSGDMVESVNAGETDSRAEYDFANYDLQIDNALKLNEKISTLKNVYYFSYPCSSTDENSDKTHSPDTDITESMFVRTSLLMGRTKGKTAGGFEFDETWYENDGLVNTISATAPFNAPSTDYKEGNVKKGVWNVMPTYRGDHMSLQGGMFKKNNVKGFFAEHLDMINRL